MVLHGIMEALCAGTWTWHESIWCYMDIVKHVKQNENTWSYMASWKHCVLEIRQCIFLALPLVLIVWVPPMIYQPPHMVLVGFGSWWGLGQNILDELASFLAPPQIMEDHQMDQPVQIALAQSGSLWLGLLHGLVGSWCLHKHMELEPNVNKWQCHQPLVQLQRGWSGPQWHTCILNQMLQPLTL